VCTYYAMELAALVALWLTPVVLGLTGTELAEVLGGLWDHVLEQLHFDAAQFLTCVLS